MRKIILSLILLCCIVIIPIQSTNRVEISLSNLERELYELIMQYRAEKGLPSIPISPSLTYVAQVHVRDMHNHPPMGDCNLHSWSEYGEWSSCCYTGDHAQAKCMWNKPRELTQYQGPGYEIAFYHSVGVTPQNALDGWKNSKKGHNDVIINQDIWNKHTWRAIGIGIYKEYAVVWFGEEKDQTVDNMYNSASTSDITTTQTETPNQTFVRKTSQKVNFENEYMELNDKNTKGDNVYNNTQDNVNISRNVEKSIDKQISNKNYDVKKVVSNETLSNTKQDENSNKRETTIVQNRINEETVVIKKEPLRKRFYNYSGYSSLSYLSVGYTYSFIDKHHLITTSLFDFRAALFGMSPLAVEFSVSPLQKKLIYKPSVRVYIPIAKCLSIAPYIGLLVDASYLGKYVNESYEYNYESDFFMDMYAGLALHLTAAKNVPIEVKAEYRHPIKKAMQGDFYPQGIYVSTQMYIGSIFNKRNN